jgi:predicted nucleotidyltransferase
MPSVAQQFSKLHARIQPTQTELDKLEQRYQSIREKLRSVFPSCKVSKMGSLSRGTGIKHKSDLDVLLEVSRDDIRWGPSFKQSTTLLRRVREALQERYPNTEIGVRSPAVVAQFGQGRPIEIVPGVFDSFHESTKVIAIPDGHGSWMPTSPQKHGRLIQQQDQYADGKLKSTAQFIKYWRHTRSQELPVQSFFVEMALAVNRTCVGAKPHSQCVAEAFWTLVETCDEPVPDPLGISDSIVLASTDAQLQRVRGGLERSAEQAAKAVEAEQNGNIAGAFSWWDKVFKGNFPKR